MKLNDALVALTYLLRHFVFLRAIYEPGLPAVLSGEALGELRSLLDLTSKLLPHDEACQALKELKDLANSAEELTHTDWVSGLKERPLGVSLEAAGDPSLFLKVCDTYTCGVWALFHILLQATGDPETDVSPLLVLSTMRGTMTYFFGCKECVGHFHHTYDSCSFDRCGLKTKDLSDQREGAALWLWQVHNNVSAIVARRGGQTARPWPQPLCHLCWPHGPHKEFDGGAVYRYLGNIYWREDWLAGGHLNSQRWTAASMTLSKAQVRSMWIFASALLVCSVGFIWRRAATASHSVLVNDLLELE